MCELNITQQNLDRAIFLKGPKIRSQILHVRTKYHSDWHKPIEIRLYRKGTYILAYIHGMDHFCTKLVPPPYNKPRSCVSKIHTPMVMVWFGNV
jgi:hypothetical protein